MISDPDRDEFLSVFLDYDVDLGLSDASVYIAWIKPMPCLRTNVTLQQFDEFYDTYGIQPRDTMHLAEEDQILVW